MPICELGGKGVFVKEVQAAVLDGRADLAVHSAKDLPSVTLDGLVLAAVPERGDPRDALVGRRARRPAPAARRSPPARCAGGPSSPPLRPDLTFVGLRGQHRHPARRRPTSSTRSWSRRPRSSGSASDDASPRCSTSTCCCRRSAQGALAVECRADDARHGRSRRAPSSTRRAARGVDAERAFLAELGGDCDLPAGAHALARPGGGLRLLGVLAADGDGRLCRRELDVGATDDPVAAGARLADLLLDDLG